MIKVLLASGGHKHLLPPSEACRAIAEGLCVSGLPLQSTLLPMADGGDGTIDALIHIHKGTLCKATVHDPLLRPRQAVFGMYTDSSNLKCGVIEIAEAAGSALLLPHERQTMVASSYGVGELLQQAYDIGCRRLIIGLGGSIVSDMGLGMAQALGFAFYDETGTLLTPFPGAGFNALSLHRVARIAQPAVRPLMGMDIVVASDVNTPLLGPKGQAATFGPQKGASPDEIRYLEDGFATLAEVIARDLHALVDLPYAGAAGGLGAGLLGFLGARLISGAALVASEAGLDLLLQNHDLVITGEGRHDATTLLEKAPYHVASRARALGIPVTCIAGTAAPEAPANCYDNLVIIQPNEAHMLPSPQAAAAGLRNAALSIAPQLLTLQRPKGEPCFD